MSRYWHCQNEGQFEPLEGIRKKGLPWHGHQSGWLGWQWWDVMWRWQDGLVPVKPEFEVIIAVIISLIFWGRFLPFVIAVTSCHWLTYQSVSPHGVPAHGEKVEALGTYEAQVVVHSLQVINCHPLILAFFPAPWAEGNSCFTAAWPLANECPPSP